MQVSSSEPFRFHDCSFAPERYHSPPFAALFFLQRLPQFANIVPILGGNVPLDPLYFLYY